MSIGKWKIVSSEERRNGSAKRGRPPHVSQRSRDTSVSSVSSSGTTGHDVRLEEAFGETSVSGGS